MMRRSYKFIFAQDLLLICVLLGSTMLPAPAQCDFAQAPVRQTLKGGISAYAKEPSIVPLMQGRLAQSLPQQWRGVWKGDVRVGDLALLKQIPATDNGAQNLTGKVAQLSLNLGSDSNEMQIPELTVSDKTRGPDSSPDIIFFHSGSHGHLRVLPGAHILEHHTDGTHSIAVGGSTFVGDGGRLGGSLGGGKPTAN